VLQHLKLNNVGPAPEMALEFGQRLNLITGDNGLGKSFLLDIAWWAMTRRWPGEVNPNLTSGKKALPPEKAKGTIAFSFTGKSKAESYTSEFVRAEQAWTGRPGRPANPGLVFYAMADGSFALWDPERNYWVKQGDADVQERQPAYVFSPAEVWDGLKSEDGGWLCNGLIRDWASWQKERGKPYKRLCAVLEVLSSSGTEVLTPGELTRISLDDVRDIPTLRMPYGKDVPVVHASSGMRRIIALAYFLVWAWEEHNKAARLRGNAATNQAVFLVDEVEAHLHPQWQRRIVPALLKVMDELAANAQVQVIAATHSPLVMASVEPLFDEAQDAWFDLDYERKQVKLRHRPFANQGDADSWLKSDAFDLPSSYSLDYEKLINKAAKLLEQESPDPKAIQRMNDNLVAALNPGNDFLFNWRAICRKKEWLK
jgi:predicted ATPase